MMAGAILMHTDCTTSCRLQDHACKCLATVALGDIKLLRKLDSICANPFGIKDQSGRNSLHVVASLGHSDIAAQLVREKRADVNEPDGESSWTALHRTAYFGHLETAVELTKLGGDLYARDNDGWTPLDLLNSDMLSHCIGARGLGLSALSTWGVNANASLGHEHSRTVPLQLRMDQRLTVKQVVLCKFHSIFLLSSGEVMTCGLGRGGRLGHGNEHAVMEPTVVSALSKVKVVQIDASRDHSVFLDSKGDAYTCGFNEAHQLGQGTNPTTAPHSLLSPLPVKGIRGVLIGVGAGRFHTAFATETALYTCGEDHGQLGYKAKYETQIVPRQVPCVELQDEESITLLSISDAATACLTSSRRIFLCYDYSVRPITVANQFRDPEVHFIQFSVCATLGDYEKRKKQILSSPVIIAMLNTIGELWYWTMEMKSFQRGVLSGAADSRVKHYTLGRRLTVVTWLGEVFSCDSSCLNQDLAKGASSSQRMSTAPGRLDSRSNGLLRVSRLGNMQNGSCIFTDFKSTNFALVQRFYSPAAKPAPENTHYPDDILSLRNGDQWFMDCVLKVHEHTVPCHRYLLAARSRTMLPQLETAGGPTSESSSSLPFVVDLSPASEQRAVTRRALQVFADYLYCTGIELSFVVSKKEHDRRSLSDDPCALSDESPRSPVLPGGAGDSYFSPFHLTTSNTIHVGTVHQSDYAGLCQLLQHTRVIDESGHLKQRQHRGKIRTLPVLPALKYSRSCSVADFFIETADQMRLPCHRCIIVARSDYFRSMLTMGWKESFQEVAVHLPFPSQVVELVLEYLYSDAVDAIHDVDTEVVMELLIASDQLLLSQLRLLCEVELAQRVTLKQVVELAEFAYTYNAHQLFIYCLQLISFNLAYYLAGGYLQGICPEVLTRLSKVYQDMVPATRRRVMRVSAPADIKFVNWLLTSEQGAESGNNLTNATMVEPPVPAKGQSGSARKKRRRKMSKSDCSKEPPSPISVPTKAPNHQTPELGATSPDSPVADTQQSTQEAVKEVDATSPPVEDSSQVPTGVTQDQKQVTDKRESEALPLASPATDGGVKVKVAWKTAASTHTSVDFQKIQHEQASAAARKPLKPPPRQPKAPPPQKQALSPTSPKPRHSVAWSGAAAPPPVPSLLEVMLQEAERETQVLKAPSEPLQLARENTGAQRKSISRGKSSPTVSSPPPVWSTEDPLSCGKPQSPAGPSISFAEIIAHQQKEAESQSRHRAKPMEDIEMEERAIQQLELLYQVADCAEEWITVERDITLTEKPTWVKECM